MSSSDGQILIDIGADTAEYDKEVGNLSSKTSGLLQGAGNVAKNVGKAIGAAAIAGTTAVAALSKKALDAYATYEQLEGGVQTLFGAGGKRVEEYAASVGKSVDEAEADFNRLIDAQCLVFENADEAYKTAGMSANEYMELATSTAAAMVSSLGGDTVAAAELTDRAIRDMSDNANKMGTDMERITDAYNGFAKGNFTMLDNLKLGYGGTKTEMERLLDDAEKLSGIHFDIDSYADIVKAIGVIQDEMGITGTTAIEAKDTIEGSINMTKAAWENWVRALGDSEYDMEAMTDQLVESATYAVKNIIPTLATVATSIADGIPALVTQVTGLLTSLIPEVLPKLLSAITGMVTSLASALTSLAPVVLDAVVQLFMSLVTVIPPLIPVILDAAIQFFLGILDALTQAAPIIVAQLPTLIDQIVNSLVDALPLLLQAGLTLFMAIATAIIEDLPQIINTLIGALPNIINTLVNFTPQLLAAAVQLFMALVRAIPQIVPQVLGAIGNLMASIPGKAMEFMGQIFDIGKDIVQGIVDGILSAPGKIADAIGGMIGDAMNWAKNLLGIASPSKVFKWYGQMIDEGLEVGVDRYSDLAVRAIDRLVDDVTEAADFGSIAVPISYSAGTLDAIASRGVTVDAAISRQSSAPAMQASSLAADIEGLKEEIRDMKRSLTEAFQEPFDIHWNRRELGRLVRSVS